MKALSIRQPWLWAILDIPENDCPKRVENRKGTAFNYRGPVLLHASSGGTRKAFAEATTAICQARTDLGFTREIGVPAATDLPRGCFIGIARIVGAWAHPAGFLGGRAAFGYRLAGQLGLSLADVRKLPPVPAPGALGLYNVEHNPGARDRRPAWVDFGEHAAGYAAAWAELAAKGGAA